MMIKVYSEGKIRYFKSERPIQRSYYSTTEIAKMLGETNYTIRFWVKEFDIKPYKSEWYRKYTPEMVAKLHKIHNLLRIQMFTIKGAKHKLINE